ncbi:unnamed protein product, partial [Polarella glacialis]
SRLSESTPPTHRAEFEAMLPFACSFNLGRNRKIHYVDVGTGDVFIHEGMNFVPDPGDGLLRWMEEYARRLESGIYSVRALRPESPATSRGICLYAAAGPDFSRCVMRGVEVTASCVYMPEHQAGWSYSISMRLVGTAAERGFKSCQLKSRKWAIKVEGEPEEIVRGDGVIGFFPILEDGGWRLNRESDPHGQYVGGTRLGHQAGHFRYQSCSGRSRSMRGTFGGELQMFPGTIQRPEGEPFWVRLEPFRLYVPDFHF